MNRVLILTAIFFLSIISVSCGGGDDTCPESDNFCHAHDGLNWSDASNSSMTWNEAINYCENLGGRLPTISELRTLVQNCPATETGGECGVTDSCLSTDCRSGLCSGCEYDDSGKYSVFGDTNWFWSFSEIDQENAWALGFYGGELTFGKKDGNNQFQISNDVRCVR